MQKSICIAFEHVKKLHVIPSQYAHWRTPGWLLLPCGQFTFWESRKKK